MSYQTPTKQEATAADTNVAAIPCNKDAERAVLGSLLIDPDAFDKIGALAARDFYYAHHQIIFATLTKLYNAGMGLDYVTVTDALAATVAKDEGWQYVAVADLISGTPTAMYADHYAAIVRKDAQRRRLISLAAKVADAAYQPDADPANLIERTLRALETVGGEMTKREPTDMRSVMQREMDHMEQVHQARARGEPLGLFFGWPLDRITSGFQDGNSVILAGRPGLGKTSVALNMAMRLAERGVPGVFFSLEMSEQEIRQKMIARCSGLDSSRIRDYTLSDEELGAYMEGVNRVAALPLHVIDGQCQTPTLIRAHLRRLLSTTDIRFAVIDYVQLMTIQQDEREQRYENRQQLMTTISQQLKQLAKDARVVLFTLSQLNRGVEYRADKRPMLADLRESGSLEQDADAVLFVYRDDYYDDDAPNPNQVELIVAKNRHGAVGTATMYLKRESCDLKPLEVERIDLNAPVPFVERAE